MLKFVESRVVFREVPDEVTLAIDISNCPIHCKGCHSKYLWNNIGTPLNNKSIDKMIDNNNGITCVALLGGDGDAEGVILLLKHIKEKYPILKTCWYSGADSILASPNDWKYIDYLKFGRYDESYGPLDNPNTNQRMLKNFHGKFYDITSKFWNNIQP